MIYLMGFIFILVVLIVICEVRYRNQESIKLQGKEDQQRYGAKYSVGKIVSYKKTWYGWKKK